MAREGRPSRKPIADDVEIILRAAGRVFVRAKYIPKWVFIAASIVMFAACFAATGKATDHVFCAASDDSVAACARNWVNAFGTTASASIAFFTAAIIFGQLRAARAQASIAVVPSLDQRLIFTAETYSKLQKVHASVYEVRSQLMEISSFSTHNVEENAQNGSVTKLLRANNSVNSFRNDFKDYVSNLRIDADIRAISEQVLTFSFIASIRTFDILILVFSPFADQFSQVKKPGIRKKVAECLEEIEEATKGINLRLAILEEYSIQLEQIASRTSQMKDRILAAQE